MIPLAPALYVAAANASIDPTEEAAEIAFVCRIGFWSHFDHAVRRSSWPLPAEPTFAALANFARRRDVLFEEPQEGDVFLKRSCITGPFMHAGIVVGVNQDVPLDDAPRVRWVCATVELDGSSGVAYSNLREFSKGDGDRFVRWVDLELRNVA